MMLDPIPQPPLTSLPNILFPRRRTLPSWLYSRTVLFAYVVLALGMVGFGWTADRLGPVMSLLGMTGVFAITAGVTLLLSYFGDWTSQPA